MIRLDHVSKNFDGDSAALNNVSLHIAPGEFVFIVGHSGAGKSTLIKLLLKETDPTKGKVYINGQDLSKVKRNKIPLFRRKVGIIFQNFRLLPDRNVYENIAFAMKVVEKPNKVIKKTIPNILALVGLSHKYKKMPNQLSGGEQQRVAIARALVNDPKILLADEPTGNLDAQNAEEVMNLLEEINENGTTVVVVTHNMDFVRKMKKRVITIEKGVIVSDVGGAN